MFIMMRSRTGVTPGTGAGSTTVGISGASAIWPTQEALPVSMTPPPPGAVYQVMSAKLPPRFGMTEWVMMSTFVGAPPPGTYLSNSPWSAFGRCWPAVSPVPASAHEDGS